MILDKTTSLPPSRPAHHAPNLYTPCTHLQPDISYTQRSAAVPSRRPPARQNKNRRNKQINKKGLRRRRAEKQRV